MKEDEIGGTCSTNGRDECNILVGNPEIKKSLRRLGPKEEDNIKMNLKGIRCDDVDCVTWLRIGFSGGLLLTW